LRDSRPLSLKYLKLRNYMRPPAPALDKYTRFLYSEVAGSLREKSVKHIVPFLAYPDKRGEFAKNLGWRRLLFRVPYAGERLAPHLVDKLVGVGHDALFCANDEQAVSHVGFQIKDGWTMGIFSGGTDPEFRGRRLVFSLCEDVVDIAREKGLHRVIIGVGSHPFGIKVYDHIASRAEQLGVRPGRGYCLEIE